MIQDRTKIYVFNDFISFYKDNIKVSDFFRKEIGKHWSIPTATPLEIYYPVAPSNKLNVNSQWNFGIPSKTIGPELEFVQNVKYSPYSQDPEVGIYMDTPIMVRHPGHGPNALEESTNQGVLRYALNGRNVALDGGMARLEDGGISFLDMNWAYRKPEYVYSTPEYNFYVPNYEKMIQNSFFPEEILPNMYVFSLVSDGDNLQYTILQGDYNSTSFYGENSAFNNVNENLRKFDKYITLNGNISLGQSLDSLSFIDGFILSFYLQTYADAFDNVSVDYLQTLQTKFGTFFNDLTETDKFNRIYNTRFQFPMFIDLAFSVPDKFSEFLETMRTHALVPKLFQDLIFDKLEAASQPNSDKEKSYYKIDLSGRPDADSTAAGYAIKKYYTFDFTDWYTNFVVEDSVSTIPDRSDVVTILDFNGILDNKDDPFINNILSFLSEREITNLKEKNFRSYEQIMNGELAKSDMIGFKITKMDALNNKIQEFWLPNISGQEIIHYVDTQVKYGKHYKYDVKAYHLVYGTEYKYLPKLQFSDNAIIGTIINSVIVQTTKGTKPEAPVGVGSPIGATSKVSGIPPKTDPMNKLGIK